MKLIDKDALVAEIKERIETYNKSYANGDDKRADALEILLHDLNTLEVKEVDLEKELIEWHKEHFKKDGTFIGMSGFYLTNNSQMAIAKHFFELGLKHKNVNNMKGNDTTLKASELIKILVDIIGQNGDADVIIDHDCRCITGAHFDTADSEYEYYGWVEIDTTEEENHRKFYNTLVWRKCQHDELSQKLNIRTSESGHRFLIVDGYELDIETLLMLPKED